MIISNFNLLSDEVLQAQLNFCIKTEDYANAALIRDEINNRSNNPQHPTECEIKLSDQFHNRLKDFQTGVPGIEIKYVDPSPQDETKAALMKLALAMGKLAGNKIGITVYCGKCNTTNAIENNFCRQCGYEIKLGNQAED